MEYQNEHSLFDMQYDEPLKHQMKAAASTAGIAAILSLVGSVLSFINYFVTRAKMQRIYNSFEGFSGARYQQSPAGGGNLVSSVLTLILAIFMFYFLSQYARLTKAGLDSNDTMQVGDGLAKLSTYFKIIGVLVIIMLVVVFLVLFVAVLFGSR